MFIVIISSFSDSSHFIFPPEKLSLRWYNQFLNTREYQSSIRVSSLVGIGATLIGLGVGIPAALGIHRYEFPGKRLLHGTLMAPLMIPGIMWAISLLQYFASFGFSGTYSAIVLAHAVALSPFVLRFLLSSLAYVDVDLEDAAKSLGASELRTFFEITLPLMMPGIIVSSIIGFMISFNDVIVSIFIAGARNITFPVRIYSRLHQAGIDPTSVAASAIIVVFILVLAVGGEKYLRWSRYF
jgi:putative spermidine/putrescine transport system permease protein